MHEFYKSHIWSIFFVLWANERNYQREPECQGGTLLNKDCTSSRLYQQVFCTGRKLILTYKLLQGVFGMKDIDFMCFEKPFPSRRDYSLRWWKALMAYANRIGVIRKIKQAFSEVNSWIIMIFSHSFPSVGLFIINFEFFYLPFPCSILYALLWYKSFAIFANRIRFIRKKKINK